ncbi:vesicle transport protein GOT1B [Eurytemora carolleeae]|uniref:vesicle transport protein GOT1B n=1 Tax=Eurytemora carolleeae TaxID=1294199 RepID=UPI000C78F217|nr:vesicle transport protein GOT1B [Eurytemora carolleeae]|eukprot:XP_023334188.1 vesicle transport protein GOT1B-like [Eurytemora affinis]
MEVTNMQKLGVGLSSFGVFFLLLGVLLLFDKGLLAIGNLFCLAGLGCVMGLEKSSSFFLQPERKKGSAAFLGGIVVLLSGYPFIGMLIEAYGFVALFGGFFPMAISFLRQVPVISLLLALPGVSDICDRIVDPKSQ